MPHRRTLSPALAALAGCGGLLWSASAHLPTVAPGLAPDEPAVEVQRLGLAADCEAEGTCSSLRRVFVDYDALAIPGMGGGEWLAYDFDEVTRAIDLKDLLDESTVSVAVRLVVSEVGADRLLINQHGLSEAVGILYTVDNRLNPFMADPEFQPGAPHYPGCGDGGTFVTCAEPTQYLGLLTWRALDPHQRYPEAMLGAASDMAVLAYWLEQRRLVPDLTLGATEYVHRCGGAGYGMTTYHCDAGTGGRRRDDIAGADPHSGPLIFKALGSWLPVRGHYSRHESRWVDYESRLATSDFTTIDTLAALGWLQADDGLPDLVTLAALDVTPEPAGSRSLDALADGE